MADISQINIQFILLYAYYTRNRKGCAVLSCFAVDHEIVYALTRL